MSSPPSTSPSSFSSGAGAVRQVPGLPSTHSGPPPSSPTTPPSEPDRVTVARPRCSTDNPVPALLVPAQAKLLSEPTPTRTSPPPLPHPGASRPTLNQHHPRKKEPSATSTAVRASPVRFACQSKYRGQHAPRYHLGADSTARFECLCIQWRRRTMDVGIPPLLTSFEACFGNWHGRDLQSLCCFSRIQATQRQDLQLSGFC